MAPNYEARLKVLLEAKQAFAQLKKLETGLKKLEVTRTGAETAKQVKQLFAKEEKAVKIAQRRLENELAINSAKELYARRVKQLERAGGATTKDLKAQLKAVQALVNLQGNNLGVLRRSATLVGRILERQKELNRADRERNAQSSRIATDYKDRIARLAAVEGETDAIKKLRVERDKLVKLSEKRQTDLAKAQEDRLKRLLKSREKANDIFLRPGARPGPASPIRGGETFVDSPEYKKAALRRREQNAKELSRRASAASKAAQKLADFQERLDKNTANTKAKLKDVEFQEELKRIKAADAAQARADKAQARREDRLFKERLAESQRIRGLRQIASPIRGSASLEGSPVALQKLNEEEDRLNKFAEAGRRIRERGDQVRLRNARKLNAEEERLNQYAAQGRRLREKASREESKRAQARRKAQQDTLRAAQKLLQLSTKAGKLAGKAQGFRTKQLALPSTEALDPGKKGIKLLDQVERIQGPELTRAATKAAGFSPQVQKRLEANRKRNIALERETVKLNKDVFAAMKKIAVERRKEGRDLIKSVQAERTRNKIIKERVTLLGPGSPQGQATFFKEQEKRSAARKKQRDQFREDLLLGAGFPLLTGGGPGAVLGGLAGAVAGGGRGGFGGQIFGSAIGQQLDTIVIQALEAAKSLTSTSSALDFVREKALFTSEGAKELSYTLEKQGDVAGLASLLTEELAQSIGNNGVQSLVDLGKTTDRTTKLWNQLTIQLQTLVSGPLNGFLELVNSFLGGITTDLRYQAAKASVANDPEKLARFEQVEREIRGSRRRNVPGSGVSGRGTQNIPNPITTTKKEQILKRLTEEGLFKVDPIIPQTLEDKRVITQDTSAVNEAQRLKERLEKLRLETAQIAKITEFKDRIATAEANNDRLTVRRIQGEQTVFELQQRQLEQLVGVTNERERAEIKALSAAQIEAALADTARDLNTIERERRENFEQNIQGLRNQLDIAEATTRQEEERLRIAGEMRQLRETGDFSEDQLADIENLKKQLNAANQPLARFIRDSQKQLNDLEQVAVNVSQGIGNAIGNSLNNGISRLIEGSETVKEVFTNMLKSIGQLLVQEGTKMIATYIAIGIAKAFAGMGGKFETAPLGEGFTTGATPSSFDAVGAGLFTPRANGGPVQAGQPYMVGERGPELFVPGTNGGVMRNDDMRQLMGRSPMGNTPQMNFSFETTNIGGQEFVSREQLEAAMATTRRQAANDGAKRGMNMTLDKMQNSPRTRSRVGIR